MPSPDEPALNATTRTHEVLNQAPADFANESRARSLSSAGGLRVYELVGHKWFMSAPVCDAFLMLAQAPAALS